MIILMLISILGHVVPRVSGFAIFVEKNHDQSGHVLQVTGDVQNGVKHEDKPAKKPEDSAIHQSKEFIGKITAADFARIKLTCEGIPAPKKQSGDIT